MKQDFLLFETLPAAKNGYLIISNDDDELFMEVEVAAKCFCSSYDNQFKLVCRALEQQQIWDRPHASTSSRIKSSFLNLH